MFKTAPEGQVYVLQEILTPMWVSFVGSGYALQSRAEGGCGLLEKLLLIGALYRLGQLVPHI